MHNEQYEYPYRQKYRPDQYSKDMDENGLYIYCECTACVMFKGGFCEHLKSKVWNEHAGCATAIMNKWLK